jgi:hypothetical protein
MPTRRPSVASIILSRRYEAMADQPIETAIPYNYIASREHKDCKHSLVL